MKTIHGFHPAGQPIRLFKFVPDEFVRGQKKVSKEKATHIPLNPALLAFVEGFSKGHPNAITCVKFDGRLDVPTQGGASVATVAPRRWLGTTYPRCAPYRVNGGSNNPCQVSKNFRPKPNFSGFKQDEHSTT